MNSNIKKIAVVALAFCASCTTAAAEPRILPMRERAAVVDRWLEEDAYFDGDKTWFIDGRQTALHLIPRAPAIQ